MIHNISVGDVSEQKKYCINIYRDEWRIRDLLLKGTYKNDMTPNTRYVTITLFRIILDPND